MDRGALWTAVREITKIQMQVSSSAHIHTINSKEFILVYMFAYSEHV